MPYNKQRETERLLTENREVLQAVSESIQTAPEPIQVSDVMHDACGVLGVVGSWQVLAAIDTLQDQGLIRFVDKQGPFTQHERYRWAGPILQPKA